MPPLRPSFTVRRLMVGVAIAAVVLGLVAYRQRLHRLGAGREAQALRLAEPAAVGGVGPGTVQVNTAEGRLAYRPTAASQRLQDEARGYYDRAMRVDLALAASMTLLLVLGLARLIRGLLRRRRP